MSPPEIPKPYRLTPEGRRLLDACPPLDAWAERWGGPGVAEERGRRQTAA